MARRVWGTLSSSSPPGFSHGSSGSSSSVGRARVGFLPAVRGTSGGSGGAIGRTSKSSESSVAQGRSEQPL
eukprot:5424791-Prymnesium_polylepis.1